MARGSVVKKATTNYCVFRDPVTKKQHWKAAGSSRRKAERMLTAIVGDIHDGAYRELEEITFAEFAKLWLQTTESLKPRTHEFYSEVVRIHLLPYFGRYYPTSIQPDMIRLFLTEKQKSGLAKKTISHQFVTLKTILNAACAWGKLKINPVQHIKGPPLGRREMKYFKGHEIRNFLEHVNPQFYALFLLAAATGMRQSEILGLAWQDVDFETNKIHVRRSIYKGKFLDTKSLTSNRTIIMSPKLATVLKKHKLESPPNDLNLVFANKNGKPLDRHNLVRREFLPALKRAGLKRIRFHDLRHSCATMLINQGESPKLVQHVLGHSSIQVTFDVYGHLMSETQKEAAARLDLFGNAKVASNQGH